MRSLYFEDYISISLMIMMFSIIGFLFYMGWILKHMIL